MKEVMGKDMHCKKRGGNFHLTGGKITLSLYTITTMVDLRVVKFTLF